MFRFVLFVSIGSDANQQVLPERLRSKADQQENIENIDVIPSTSGVAQSILKRKRTLHPDTGSFHLTVFSFNIIYLILLKSNDVIFIFLFS